MFLTHEYVFFLKNVIIVIYKKFHRHCYLLKKLRHSRVIAIPKHYVIPVSRVGSTHWKKIRGGGWYNIY